MKKFFKIITSMNGDFVNFSLDPNWKDNLVMLINWKEILITPSMNGESEGRLGLMEFKELFGSFTGHRVENRSTGMRYGSTGGARSQKWELGFQGAVGDGV
ncbi:hypothetical protein HanRHA438_Chr03g0146241 [Helianthus annuus]|nr:hypothetical protein HanRHA438_Chr03g0146241 [Helianthus annuus]